MHITLESDYAIRIVIFLLQYGKRADAKKIAENTQVTLRFSLKILRKLAAARREQSRLHRRKRPAPFRRQPVP